MVKRILTAEDDGNIREGIVDILEAEGYEVRAACNGEQALDFFRSESFDLVILDVMMPEASGYDVCREIRAKDQSLPILMLSAKSEEIDKVLGLELGADDYIAKPFGVRELVARVRAALRRSELNACCSGGRKGLEDLPDSFAFGEATIDRREYRGMLGDCSFSLQPKELELLEFFAERPGAAVSRDRLMREFWGDSVDSSSRTLDQHIARLRKKVEPNPTSPRFLTTVHGVGYRYEP